MLELFFQVFDKGRLDDAEGREIDFRNTVIILTSNVGSSQIMQACLGEGVFARPTEALGEALRTVLYKQFKPAFLRAHEGGAVLSGERRHPGRDHPPQARAHRQAHPQQSPCRQAGRPHWKMRCWRCTEVDSGARNVDHILNGTLLPTMAETVLGHMSEGREIGRIRVGANKRGEFTHRVS